MKFSTSIVASLLAYVAVALPRASGEGDPLTEVSRMTAFVVDEKGNPTIECWEISKLVETSQIPRADGTSATAQALSLASSSDLDGVDILTWPTASRIWPLLASGAVHTDSGLDLSLGFSLFNVQGGLINFNFHAGVFGVSSDEDEVETHIFSLENGDDWFYFEDAGEPGSIANTKPYPFEISTISATETEILRLRYKQQPKHKVVHKGACSFTGIKTPAETSSRGAGATRIHSPLTVQVTLEDSL